MPVPVFVFMMVMMMMVVMIRAGGRKVVMMNDDITYRKIPIISPGIIFVQRGLVIGRNFAFQNGFGLSVKTANSNSSWAFLQ